MAALLLDLTRCCSSCCSPGASLLQEANSHVFLLCGAEGHRPENSLSDPFLRPHRAVHVLDSGSTAECLYRLKRSLDDLDLSAVRVLTTARGREVLARYQELLFTAVYTFDYDATQADKLTCSDCCGSAHTDSPEGEAEEEVSAFLQQLPALKGDIRTLRSTLIPDCFGHGFSTRSGGVSYIPTLSSLNLFSSSRRRDPRAVVDENRRRLAVHAGFHPMTLRLVKVNHASDVWVLGKPEPESYDSMVTDQTGVVLAGQGADCLPILFADPVKKVIGAAHAGWRGTVMGVATATVDAMVTNFGCRYSDIVVAVGPSVGVCCFTLDREQAADFISIHPDCVPDPESARPHVDILLANRYESQESLLRSQSSPPEARRPSRAHPRQHGRHPAPRDALHLLQSQRLLLPRQRRTQLRHPSGFPVDQGERGTGQRSGEPDGSTGRTLRPKVDSRELLVKSDGSGSSWRQSKS